MTYLKSNPKALLDAIPTPRGEEEKALRDFRNGLNGTQKADMNFSNNDATNIHLKSKTNQGSTFGGSSSNYATPSKNRM